MSNNLPRPMCFIAMPFGKKPPPGKKKPVIDFNRIYHFIEHAVTKEGLECIRADFEAIGGFIHRPMYERLLVAEYVVADLTMANPNVTYEVGVRHGSGAKATILICAQNFIDKLPFDLKPLRVLTYPLDKDGHLSESEGKKLGQGLHERLRQAIANELPADNPILQITAIGLSGRVQHEKTDVFLKRMRYASEIGERVHNALTLDNSTVALTKLQKIQKELLAGPQVVSQLHTALISLYIGYREKKAYQQMITLFSKLPNELQRTPVAIEQLALALNRLSEKNAKEGDLNKANQLRRKALNYLDKLPKKKWSSETFGIAGRIYKGQSEAYRQADNFAKAKAALQRAIETYESGFWHDPRDYYPGVNAVTLRFRRGSNEDKKVLETLMPAVRFSVNRAPTPETEEERYWQEATKLELACDDEDWDNARTYIINILAIDAENWMRETTINNLEILKKAFVKDDTAINTLDELIKELTP